MYRLHQNTCLLTQRNLVSHWWPPLFCHRYAMVVIVAIKHPVLRLKVSAGKDYPILALVSKVSPTPGWYPPVLNLLVEVVVFRHRFRLKGGAHRCNWHPKLKSVALSCLCCLQFILCVTRVMYLCLNTFANLGYRTWVFWHPAKHRARLKSYIVLQETCTCHALLSQSIGFTLLGDTK